MAFKRQPAIQTLFLSYAVAVVIFFKRKLIPFFYASFEIGKDLHFIGLQISAFIGLLISAFKIYI